LLHARISYRIYQYDKTGIASVLLLPKDAIPFPKAPKNGATVFPGPEPLIVKPGKTAPAASAAKPAAGEKAVPAEAAGEGGGKPGAPPGPPGGRPTGEAGPPSGVAPPTGTPTGGFTLTYPLGSQLKLTKPGETSIDEILRPERYRSRTDINFSTYLRPDPTAKAPSGRFPTGRGGGGGGGGTGGRRGPGASVTLGVARYDFAGWGSAVLAKIQKTWTLESPEDAGYRVEVRVAVMMSRNGDLLAVDLETSSNVEALDRAALHAVRAAGPFPALPADFPKSSLDMVLVFQYGYY